jgi:hypothetical protein
VHDGVLGQSLRLLRPASLASTLGIYDTARCATFQIRNSFLRANDVLRRDIDTRAGSRHAKSPLASK